jgi:uncharacterized Zn-finger protein
MYLIINLTVFLGILQQQNGRWMCPNIICGRTYKNKFSLNRHCQLECGVKPQYHCPLCIKTYKRKDSLKTHLLTH